MRMFAGYVFFAIVIGLCVWLDPGNHKPEKKETPKKKSSYKLFDKEAKILGLDEYEKEQCLKAGITPEEWAEENDPNYRN